MASEQIIHFLNLPEDLHLVLRIQEDSCGMKSPIINQIPGTKLYFPKHCELSLKEIRAPMNTLQCILHHPMAVLVLYLEGHYTGTGGGDSLTRFRLTRLIGLE